LEEVLLQPASPERSPNPGFSVRPARPADVSFLVDLSRRVFLEFGSYDRYIQEWFGEPIVSTFVAEVEGAPVGFVMLAIHPQRPTTDAVGEIISIAVAPEHRSTGIGAALLDRAIAHARESSLGLREIRLSVAEGNARAQRMFARRAFRIGHVVGVYPAGQRALFMTKALKKEGKS
jgi:ribosomal protein S18 acetylase RimI-like enzyme